MNWSRIRAWLDHRQHYPNGATYSRRESMLFSLFSVAVILAIIFVMVDGLPYLIHSIVASWRWDGSHSLSAVLHKDVAFGSALLVPLIVIGIMARLWAVRQKNPLRRKAIGGNRHVERQ